MGKGKGSLKKQLKDEEKTSSVAREASPCYWDKDGGTVASAEQTSTESRINQRNYRRQRQRSNRA